MLRLYPGSNRTDVYETLRMVHGAALNAYAARTAPGIDFYNGYMRWTHESARLLRHRLRAEDIDRLIFTRRYSAIQTSPHPAAPPILDLVEMELIERIEDIKDEFDELRGLMERWQDIEHFVVPETSMIMNYSWTLDCWDLAPLLKAGESTIHLVIPLAVVDELDNLKDRGQDRARTRARTSLRTIVGALTDPRDIGTLRESGFSPNDTSDTTPRGAITIEVLFDDPRHERLPNMDEEIIDRAVTVRDLAGRPVIFMTNDTGQSLRARRAGLEVLMMPRSEEK
ncbi:hypothetical protein GCM10009530_63630 [Microbispora corallina]|uniref:PIN domain-containing protein n=1 Tax=Microbispora corallina TaxID=83302 RepID=A0ABQ4GC54_9ACTN|nr:PIN domain-containing protein [Microbispora corallina]GIH44586.1 hypothetical protein Mco01_75860 [Microbispora corallina]